MSKKRQEGLFKGERFEWSLSCFVDISEEEKKKTSGKSLSVSHVDHVLECTNSTHFLFHKLKFSVV